MWKWKSDWGWCLGGAYFLAKFQAGGAYSGGAYKKNCVSHDENLSHHKKLPQIIQIITTKQYNLSPLTLTNQKDNFIPWTA